MFHRIGFAADFEEPEASFAPKAAAPTESVPRRSVVSIHFPARNMTLSYYNDAFDLKVGDLVYVDGKLEGLRGRVVDISYNFKIRLSDYKRVIGVADTSVKGEFIPAGSHFVTFDRAALPYSKALTWFKAPGKAEDVYVSGSDSSSFLLDKLSDMKASCDISSRGFDYYIGEKVKYICLDGTHGRAMVEGTQYYEVEFECRGREISGLTCGCYCSGACKHEVAAMYQLRETLDLLANHYETQYAQSGYFAAVSRSALNYFALSGRENGKIVFG